MTDGPTGPVQVHSLLHVNLNSVDVATSAAFYADVLGLTPGMKTARVAADGRALGVEGTPVSEAWFLYDHRGPRTAPAIEVLEWETPATTGTAPAEAHHIGLGALGYVVPSVADVCGRAASIGGGWADLADWPVRGRVAKAARLTDMDGVAVEVVAGGASLPVFSHLRLNCADLDASVAWYQQLGFAAETLARSVAADGAVVSCASMITSGDPSFSLELTQWDKPKGAGAAIAPAYHRGLYRIALGVDDVRAAHQALAALEPGLAEPEFVELPGTRLGGVVVMFLRDPDGVVVELVGRPRSAMTARA